jgi:NADH-quinone oxidoreductase subunit L
MAGTLAITGVGIYDIGFAGFYSKDAIIEAAYARGTTLGEFASVVGITAALLTSFYSWRLMFLTFFGKPRWEQSEHIQHAVHDAHGHDAHTDHSHPASDGTMGYHPRESPLSMLVPLIVLALGAVFAGALFHTWFVGADTGAGFWQGALVFDRGLMEAAEHSPWVKWAPFTVMLTGFGIAWYGYMRNPKFPAAVAEQLGVIYDFVYNKWYFDELYDFIFVQPAFWLGRQFWKLGDIGIIDRFGPNGAAWVVKQGAIGAKKLQSGYLTSYALVMLLGLVAAVSWAMVG